MAHCTIIMLCLKICTICYSYRLCSMYYIILLFFGFSITQDLTYAELSTVSPTQRIPYATATLGRPRTAEFKRHEPTIYAQVNGV